MQEILKTYLGNQKALDKKLFDVLVERKYTMKDVQELNTDITYRTINHWSEKGYLLTETREGDWRKFSFAEYIWILFLNELRELNVSFAKIIPSLFIDLGLSDTEMNEMEDIQIEKLRKSDFEKVLKRVDREQVLERFCWWLVAIISYKTPITIRFFKDGSSIIIYGNPAYHGLRIKTFLDEYKRRAEESNFSSTISISIDSLIKDFIKKKDLDNISDANIFSDGEMEVLGQLRNGEIKEIKVFFESGKPVRLEIVDEVSSIDAAKRIKENFFTDYQRCEYITNGGKSHTLIRTTSKKLSK
ncbi:MAG: MerR family transcriptional regulator [Chitinophagaceae bacterium]